MTSLLLRHLSGEPIGRFPVWMMRQAGRYLPAYRELRARHGFWESVTDPALAAKITLMPLDVVPVDALILFSDILTLPHGLGIPIELKESVGPVTLSPLEREADFDIFERFEPRARVPYVGEALSAVRAAAAPEKAVLGFAGAPWTVACYLVQGKPTKGFERIKAWMYRDPQGLARALGRLGGATLDYLRYQATSGAEMVQLFDTWLSEMPRWFFIEYYRPILDSIFGGLRASHVGGIYYSRHAHHLLPDLKGLPADVFSTDSLRSLSAVEGVLGEISLQGNLDPALLLSGDPALVRRETRRLVAHARSLRRPPILNLGHGILPGTSVECAVAFAEEARELWI